MDRCLKWRTFITLVFILVFCGRISLAQQGSPLNEGWTESQSTFDSFVQQTLLFFEGLVNAGGDVLGNFLAVLSSGLEGFDDTFTVTKEKVTEFLGGFDTVGDMIAATGQWLGAFLDRIFQWAKSFFENSTDIEAQTTFLRIYGGDMVST